MESAFRVELRKGSYEDVKRILSMSGIFVSEFKNPLFNRGYCIVQGQKNKIKGKLEQLRNLGHVKKYEKVR